MNPAAPSPAATAPLFACTNIVTAGAYTLDRDLTSRDAGGSCLTIKASNVSLDCGKFFAGGIRVEANPGEPAFNNVTITNCQAHDIYLRGGGYHHVVDNIIDGGYHGSDFSGVGSDRKSGDAQQGIRLWNESNDVIEGNTISNTWDAGIEGFESVNDTLITNNTMSNTLMAGVRSYYCTAWRRNGISGSTVSRSVMVLRMSNSIVELCQAAGTFVDNQILSNSLVEAYQPNFIGLLFDFVTSGSVGTSSGNLVQGNDLGTTGLALRPATGFVDGGGNRCNSVFSNVKCE